MTFTAHGVGAGTGTVTVSASPDPSATETVNVYALASPSPATLTFNGTTATQTFTVVDHGPAGVTVTATSSNPSVATVDGPFTTSNANGTVTFTVTPKNGSVGGVVPASTTISLSDNAGCTTGNVTATVTPGSLTLSTTSLTFMGTGSPQTFTASETDYTGALSLASPTPNPSVATISGSGTGPGPVTFTVTPVGFGKTTAAIKDDHAGNQSVAILVSGASLAISGSATATFNAPDNTNAHLAASAIHITGTVETTTSGQAQIYVSSPASISGSHGGSIPIGRLSYNCTGNGSGNNQGATFAGGFLQLVAGPATPTSCATFPANQFSNLDLNLNLFLDDRSMPADSYTSTNSFSVVLSAT